MFRQLKGRAFQEEKQRESVIPLVGGTKQTHEANKHPRFAPCRAHGLLEDYDEVQRICGDYRPDQDGSK